MKSILSFHAVTTSLRKGGCTIVAALTTASLWAAGAATAVPALSLEDCLRLAADHQPLLAAVDAGVTAANEAVGEARAPYWPQVDLSAGYHRWQKRAFLPAGLTLPGRSLPELIGPLDDWTGGLSSRVTLFDFGERRAGLDAARARLDSARADAAAARGDVRLSVQAAFYALAAAQELLTVAERNLARTEGHLALARVRREAGAVPEADVLRAQAEVAAAQLQQISARSRGRTAAGQLNTVMGRPAETPLAIAPPALAASPPAPTDLVDAVRQAVARRPELKAEQRRVEAARAGVDGARAARAPKLRADGSYGWNDTDFLPGTREWQVGLSVDLPVFDAGSRAHRTARTKAELAREQAAYDSRVLQVRQEVWAAAAELERAGDSIAATEANVRASAESLRVVRERYRSGAALITDLLDTQTALATAEAALAGARWTYLTARAAYDRAIGAGP
ncbi:MAG: TolC family protein [Opitutaceae bacterium]|nr:TolC family protein [Opitutaceae bacterium]